MICHFQVDTLKISGNYQGPGILGSTAPSIKASECDTLVVVTHGVSLLGPQTCMVNFQNSTSETAANRTVMILATTLGDTASKQVDSLNMRTGRKTPK